MRRAGVVWAGVSPRNRHAMAPPGIASSCWTPILNVSSFGEDEAGEVCVVDLKGGVYRVAAGWRTHIPLAWYLLMSPSMSSEQLASEQSFARAPGVPKMACQHKGGILADIFGRIVRFHSL